MSKHTHLKSLKEQMANTGHGSAPFHHERIFDQTNFVVDQRPIQMLAYQLHEEKGGTDLENWYEAERITNNNY